MHEPYDQIGGTYVSTRQADPRIAAVIAGALADAVSVANVGAGTGSYEPRGLDVRAVEPSPVMIAQRPPGAAPVVPGRAEDLPLADDSVDAAMVVLSLHHWADVRLGLGELRRVARSRVVVLTWDPFWAGEFWLAKHYFPGLERIDRVRFPPLAELAAVLGPVRVTPVEIPHDCSDGFLAAFWRRPEAYLDPEVRANISTFVSLEESELRWGLARLREDLESGAWDRRFGALRERERLDLGYRLVVHEKGGSRGH